MNEKTIYERRKGKSYEELYGFDKASNIKKRISESHKGQRVSPKTEFKKGCTSYMKDRIGKLHHSFGKSMSEETKKKISLSNKISLKKYYSENDIWNKGLTKETSDSVNSISKNMKGNKNHEFFTDKTIEKLRIARSKVVLPVKDTTIEVKVQDFLKELNYNFFTHQYIKDIEHSYQCDVLIPSLNLVIECDGDYWHKYPVGNNIDHIRTKELIEKGFKVLRLWECEIREMNLKDFEDKLNG